mgnify:CR=1 FL=1
MVPKTLAQRWHNVGPMSPSFRGYASPYASLTPEILVQLELPDFSDSCGFCWMKIDKFFADLLKNVRGSEISLLLQ